jgi:ribosomal protein S18 acetylase RimI-like enzyme
MKWEIQTNPNHEDIKTLVDGINQETKPNVDPLLPYAIFIRDSNNQIQGGVNCYTLHGGLYIDLLWVAPAYRHQGLGSQLIARAEQMGRQRGCTFAYLQTMDWEAPDLYKKLGYIVEHTRQGYQENTCMILLRKNLI